MFDRWFVLDAAADQAVLEGAGKKVVMPSLAGQDRTGETYLGQAALKKLYEPGKEFRSWDPFDHDRPGEKSEAMVNELLRECAAFDGFMAPCVDVRLCHDHDVKLEDAWKAVVAKAGGRKVRFSDRMSEKGTALVVMTEYSGTEMGWFINGSLSNYTHILYGAQACDEGVRDAVARKYRVLLHMEDARALRKEASNNLWKGKDAVLEVSGMNRYGHYERVRVSSMEIFNGMRPALEQIVLWVQDLLGALLLESRHVVLEDGIRLRGCLNDCFGLPQMLAEKTGYPVRREE